MPPQDPKLNCPRQFWAQFFGASDCAILRLNAFPDMAGKTNEVIDDRRHYSHRPRPIRRSAFCVALTQQLMSARGTASPAPANGSPSSLCSAAGPCFARSAGFRSTTRPILTDGQKRASDRHSNQLHRASAPPLLLRGTDLTNDPEISCPGPRWRTEPGRNPLPPASHSRWRSDQMKVRPNSYDFNDLPLWRQSREQELCALPTGARRVGPPTRGATRLPRRWRSR